jgi:hypothetical protein
MAFARALLGCVVLVASGCHAGAPSLALAPSLMPNLGVAAAVAQPLSPARGWHLEARFTYQFVDDKAFADNGLPEAGDWTQLDLGMLYQSPWADGRSWSTRFGLVGFEARGEPNLVGEAGDYGGVYLGLGRFALFGEALAIGPELTLVAASGPDPKVLIPQLTWGLRWTPGP